ncbi:MAG: PspC domain-containing protein [Solirubrobacteraceae bacterium]|nr:PspC domain-containing protein [Solirubrobacteraceae bacterium]
MTPDPPTDPQPLAPPRPDVTPDGPGPDPGLFRSDTDRMIFGVCGGIAERYRLDPPVVRLLFLGSLVLGGAGLLFYLAAAVLVPAPPTDGGPAGRAGAGQTGATSAVNGALRLVITLSLWLALLVVAGIVAVVSLGVTAMLGPWPVVVALVGAAALLVVGGLGGRLNRALLVVILALAVPATVAVVADLDVDPSVGERTVRPTTVAAATSGARLGLGHMTLDLRDLRPRDGATITVPAAVDVGRLDVLLPEDRCVHWSVRSEQRLGGETTVLGRRSYTTWFGGRRSHDVEIDPAPADDRRPRVVLDLRADAGLVAIGHDRSELDAHRDGRPSDDDASTTLSTAACAGGRRG